MTKQDIVEILQVLKVLYQDTIRKKNFVLAVDIHDEIRMWMYELKNG